MTKNNKIFENNEKSIDFVNKVWYYNYVLKNKRK